MAGAEKWGWGGHWESEERSTTSSDGIVTTVKKQSWDESSGHAWAGHVPREHFDRLNTTSLEDKGTIEDLYGDKTRAEAKLEAMTQLLKIFVCYH